MAVLNYCLGDRTTKFAVASKLSVCENCSSMHTSLFVVVSLICRFDCCCCCRGGRATRTVVASVGLRSERKLALNDKFALLAACSTRSVRCACVCARYVCVYVGVCVCALTSLCFFLQWNAALNVVVSAGFEFNAQNEMCGCTYVVVNL